MERFQEVRDRSKTLLRNADHMLTMTYPLVKDPKLLLVVAENVVESCTSAITALLHYERFNKSIPPFHDSFENKMQMFRQNCARKYNISTESLNFVEELRNLLQNHKTSPMEFARKDMYVICSDKYSMKTLSAQQLKQNISKAKNFVSEVLKPIEGL
jgi:hypothetical protein